MPENYNYSSEDNFLVCALLNNVFLLYLSVDLHIHAQVLLSQKYLFFIMHDKNMYIN
jgi:hypothetical protein